VSANFIKNDGTQRFTEKEAKKGSIGLLQGSDVVKTAIKIIKSNFL
jgi:2,3-bisphosphoglycerate-independent phosphoglycerate mutase